MDRAEKLMEPKVEEVFSIFSLFIKRTKRNSNLSFRAVAEVVSSAFSVDSSWECSIFTGATLTCDK